MKNLSVSALETTPKDEAAKNYMERQLSASGRLAPAFGDGWDARTDHLNKVLFGETEAIEPIEMALRAYGVGYEEGSRDNEDIVDQFENFARVVHGADPDSLQGKEAKRFLEALEASRQSA